MAVRGGRGVRTRGFLPTRGGRCVHHMGPWADLPARNLPSWSGRCGAWPERLS